MLTPHDATHGVKIRVGIFFIDALWGTNSSTIREMHCRAPALAMRHDAAQFARELQPGRHSKLKRAPNVELDREASKATHKGSKQTKRK